MYERFLSWRYLFARRTNLIGMVGIFVGVGALILILSIMAGFLEESRRALRGSLSDVIVTPGPMRKADGSLVATGPDGILEVLRADPRVRAATPQLTWLGMLVQGGRATALDIHHLSTGRFVGVELVGVDLEGEFETTELREALTRESRYGLGQVADPSEPFAPPPDWEGTEPWSWVVVGEQLARQHDLYRGAEINIGTMVPDPASGEVFQSNRKFLVAGTFRSRENEVDLSRVYLDRRELADFLGGERTFSQVLVKLRNYPRDSGAFAAEARAALAARRLIRGDAYEVRTWEQYRGNILGAIENEKMLMGIMLSLVLIVAGFTVFAILSMMVTEKRRDIGILTALGATPRGILRLFLMIGFWDALIGAFLGAVCGVWAAVEIDDIEQWLSATFGWQIFNRDVYLFDHIPTVVEAGAVALIVLGALACTLLFAAIPAWRAARMHPLDALRYE